MAKQRRNSGTHPATCLCIRWSGCLPGEGLQLCRHLPPKNLNGHPMAFFGFQGCGVFAFRNRAKLFGRNSAFYHGSAFFGRPILFFRHYCPSLPDTDSLHISARSRATVPDGGASVAFQAITVNPKTGSIPSVFSMNCYPVQTYTFMLPGTMICIIPHY